MSTVLSKEQVVKSQVSDFKPPSRGICSLDNTTTTPCCTSHAEHYEIMLNVCIVFFIQILLGLHFPHELMCVDVS